MAGKKQTRFEMIVGAVDKFSGPFRAFNQKVEKSTQGLRKFGDATKNLGRESGLWKIGKSAKQLKGAVGEMWGEVQKLSSRVTGMAGKLSLLFGVTGGGLLALAKNTADAGDAAAKAAQRAGMGVEVWQEWSHVASLSGASVDDMQKSLSRLGEQAINAATGGKQQALWFKRAGISIKDASGKLKSNDELMMELSGSVKKLTDAGQKAKALSLAKGILGDGGEKLLPMLNEGAEGIKAMRLEAHELGLVFSEESAADAEKFNDSLDTLKGGLRGIGFTIGKEFMPILTGVIGRITDWIKANRQLIESKVKEWAENFEKILPKLETKFFEVCDAVKELFNRIDRFASFIGGWGNLLLGLGAIMAKPLLMSIMGAAKAFIGLGVAIMTTPVGWIMAGVAAIAGGAYLIYKNWGGIASWFKGLFGQVKTAFQDNWLSGIVAIIKNFTPAGWVLQGMSKLIEYFTGIDLMACGEALVASIGRGLEQKWLSVVKWFQEKVKQFTALIPDWLKDKMGISGNIDVADSSPMSAPSSFTAPDLGAASMSSSIHQSTLTKIEREEVKVSINPPDGWGMQISGTKSGSGLNLSPAYTGGALY